MSRLTDAELLGMARGYIAAEKTCLVKIEQCVRGEAFRTLEEIARNATRNAVALAKGLVSASDNQTSELSSCDIDILKWLRRMLADESFEPTTWESSIAVLDKILNARSAK